jgi:hypothetical protein
MAKVDQHLVQPPQNLYGTRVLSKETVPNPGIPQSRAGAKGDVRSAKCKKRTLPTLAPPFPGRCKVIIVQYVMVEMAILHSYVVTGPRRKHSSPPIVRITERYALGGGPSWASPSCAVAGRGEGDLSSSNESTDGNRKTASRRLYRPAEREECLRLARTLELEDHDR